MTTQQYNLLWKAQMEALNSYGKWADNIYTSVNKEHTVATKCIGTHNTAF